ncbi:MAG: HD domain-containing protein [Burkholderiales bacterium]
MKTDEYKQIKDYMHCCMGNSSHDREHVMRVLFTALRLARAERGIDFDILIAACLLHDIGRDAQLKDPKICHAAEGAKMAEAFLLGIGWEEARAKHVSDCIRTHRWRNDDMPQSMEAKVLFDADKLDVTGAMGIARTLMYQGEAGEPLYTVSGGGVCPGTSREDPESFYKEYNIKLKNIGAALFTKEARRIACERSKAAEAFYDSLTQEVSEAYAGKAILDDSLEQSRY